MDSSADIAGRLKWGFQIAPVIAILTLSSIASTTVLAQSGFRPAQTAPRELPPNARPSTGRFQRATFATPGTLPVNNSTQAQKTNTFSNRQTRFRNENPASNIRWNNAVSARENRPQQQPTRKQQPARNSAFSNPQQAPKYRPATREAYYQRPVRNTQQFNATQQRITQSPIQRVQHVRNARKPLPQQILSMPRVQESMEVIHHRSQLLVARSNIVRTAIADDSVIDIAQYSPREISIIGIGMGSTTLTIWFENNPNPLIYLVQTIADPGIEERKQLDYGRLERKLHVLFPNSKVYLIPISGKIVVKGQARSATEAAKILQIVRNEVINQDGRLGGPQPSRNNRNNNTAGLNQTTANSTTGLLANDLASSYIVNMLEVPGEYQVQLRVRIAELNRSELKRLGIDFGYLLNGGRHAVSYALGGLPSTITGVFENGEINVLVNWLASNGTAKILSEPVLTVLSGHSASMLSGGEFAVPTIVGIGGAQGQQTTFRGFGTSLVVTPTVLDRDLIRMNIQPEFSQINAGNSVNGIPGVDSRRVQTTIELREGQTIAIAGLLSHRMNTEVTRIPLLSSIPYLGSRIFSAKRSTVDETELLILVTPELVRPMDADEVPPVPGFNVTPPNSHELYKHAMTEGAPDNEVYQLAPYGRGAGVGQPIGYRLHNPSPATPGYSPAVTDPHGFGQPVRRPPNSTMPPGQRPLPNPQQNLPNNLQPQPVPPRPSSVNRNGGRRSSRNPGRTLPARFSGNGNTSQQPQQRKSIFSTLGLSRSNQTRR
jgi:pilus assembly protein CpaC